MIDIFEYTDYRRFLTDFQTQEHARNPHFSHRYFAARAGFSSSGFLTNIIKGRRNLTGPMICKFSRALKLNKKEETYFEHLVRFNQASSLEEKNKYYGRMLEISPVKTKIIGRDRHEFYSQWWYSAIRELIYYYRFKDDFQDLARKLDPPISVQQAKSAIKVLKKLGLIEKDSEGFYHQTSSVITTGEQHESSLHVQNFQKSTMDLAASALTRHRKDIRDISTLTLTLSHESFRKAKLEIEALQKKLLKIAEEDKCVDSVYQVNFQMFPLTRIEKTR
ncbi:MAG: TIGR02147 family protein [Fibrobacter sp.]|nr:TIGR02147 family protein [Fibrobacter sp.]